MILSCFNNIQEEFVSLSLFLGKHRVLIHIFCLNFSGRNKMQGCDYFISKKQKVDISAIGHLPSRIILPIYHYFIKCFCMTCWEQNIRIVYQGLQQVNWTRLVTNLANEFFHQCLGYFLYKKTYSRSFQLFLSL